MTIDITKDISDSGVCVLTTSELQAGEFLLTFFVETDSQQGGLPFFRANIIRQNSQFGFFEYGLLVSEYLNDNYSSITNVVEGLIINLFRMQNHQVANAIQCMIIGLNSNRLQSISKY